MTTGTEVTKQGQKSDPVDRVRAQKTTVTKPEPKPSTDMAKRLNAVAVYATDFVAGTSKAQDCVLAIEKLRAGILRIEKERDALKDKVAKLQAALQGTEAQLGLAARAATEAPRSPAEAYRRGMAKASKALLPEPIPRTHLGSFKDEHYGPVEVVLSVYPEYGTPRLTVETPEDGVLEDISLNPHVLGYDDENKNMRGVKLNVLYLPSRRSPLAQAAWASGVITGIERTCTVVHRGLFYTQLTIKR